jgi:hypothetical protein
MNQADAVEKKPESPSKAKTPALHIEPAVVIFTEEETKYIKDVFNEVKTITDIDQLREIWSEDKKYLDVNIDGITLKDLISNRVAELKGTKPVPAVEVTE